MLCINKKRYPNWVRQKYHSQVQEYLQEHGFEIVGKIYNGVLGNSELTQNAVTEVLVGNYPVAPWVDKKDVVKQFVALLEEVGYTFTQSSTGRYCFKDKEIYGAIVKNHLNFSGRHILNNLSEYCEQNHGRLTYYQAQRVLGVRYPKAPYVDKTDIRACVILFLKETGIPFKFDDFYLYFP